METIDAIIKTEGEIQDLTEAVEQKETELQTLEVVAAVEQVQQTQSITIDILYNEMSMLHQKLNDLIETYNQQNEAGAILDLINSRFDTITAMVESFKPVEPVIIEIETVETPEPEEAEEVSIIDAITGTDPEQPEATEKEPAKKSKHNWIGGRVR